MEKSHNYELAYHLNPNLEEARVLELKQEIQDQIISNKGTVSYSKDPERTRLSYSIQHQSSSYFGYFHFSLEDAEEAMTAINNHLKLINDIMRCLIVKMPSDAEKKQMAMRQIKTKEVLERKSKAKPATEKEEKEIEKQLEDVIEKL